MQKLKKLTKKLPKKLPEKLFTNRNPKIFIWVAVFGVIGAYLVFSSSALEPYTNSDITAVKTLGIYPGFGNAAGKTNHERWESLLGRRITVADANLGKNTWSEFGGSSWGNFEESNSLFRNRPDVSAAVTIPLRVSTIGSQTTRAGGPEIIRKELQDTANGLNDSKYQAVANRMVKFGQKKAILRIGHEADIDYYPWSFRNGNEDAYIQAFRHVVELFRSTPGNEFLVDYQGNGSFEVSYKSPRSGVTQPYGDAGYPGDAYVDIIGVDVYNRRAWTNVKARLDYTQDLAKRHGKPMSIPEWGIWVGETGDDPVFIQNMYDWINTTPKTGPGRIAYHSYFEGFSESDLEKAPRSKAKFIDLFKNKGGTNPGTNLPNVNIVDGSLTTIPANPKVGDEVSFQVTIKNDGTATTPSGVQHGVSFWVNNTNVAWSDNSTAALVPGATRVLTTNGGPDGNATWTATAGSVAVTAKWDNTTPPRITESDTVKDTEERTITVTDGPTNNLPNVNIVPSSLITIPAAPKAGDEVRFQVTIKNDGTAATPNGIIHGVAFIINGNNVAWSDDSTAALAPGATRVLTTNGGPDGNATWTATQGSVAVTAKWDNTTPPRITESDDIKDTEDKTFTVAGSGIDTEPPTATITTNLNGIVDTDTLTINVNATDNVAVARVVIEVVEGAGVVSGTELVSDNTQPYSLVVNTKALANGNYTVRAASYDTSGNKTASSPAILKVRLVDINRSGSVEIGDLTAVITSWNQNNPAKATNPAYDLDNDGVIGIGDLTKIVSRWGR